MDSDNEKDSVRDENPQTPPPVPTPPPTPDEEWARRLGLQFDPEEAKKNHEPKPAMTPPPMQQPGQPMQPMQPGQPFMTGQPQMPPSYLVWSVISIVVCCLIPGIVALVYSLQVSSKFYAGDIEGARRASDRAQIWIIVSIVLGVISAGFYIPMALFQP